MPEVMQLVLTNELVLYHLIPGPQGPDLHARICITVSLQAQ